MLFIYLIDFCLFFFQILITMLRFYYFAMLIRLSMAFQLPSNLINPLQRKSFVSEIGKNEDLADFNRDSSQAYTSHFLKTGNNLFNNRLRHFVDEYEDYEDVKEEEMLNVTTNWLTQPLDHFNKNDKRIWKQRYFSNSQFYQPNGPIFLYIEGESEEDGEILKRFDTSFFQWANETGAYMFDIEHRYYGFSRPTPNQSVKNLKYLSSEQALADIANFIEAMNENLNLTNSKWIIFGCSYSGALSAWFREKYPELSVGAVASSAPIYAKVDYFEYLEVVEKVYYDYNPKCSQNIAKAFQEVESNLYSINGRKKLNDIFQLTKPFSSDKTPNLKNIQLFLQNLILSPFGGIVQYDADYRGDVAHRCKEMMANDTKSPIENLKNIFANFTIDNDYKHYILNLRRENFDGGNMDRTWLWQNCNEFGEFQTTDMGRNIFGDSIPINFYIDICTDVYGNGFDRKSIDKGVAITQKTYGGGTKHYNATRVVFPNGSNDPWHTLSLDHSHNNDPNGITSILIHGTSHCYDMWAPKESDPPQLTQAREKIRKLIKYWLSE